MVETPGARRIFASRFAGSVTIRTGIRGAPVERHTLKSIIQAMPKEGQIVTEGTVTQVLPGTMFRIDLPGQRNVLAHILGQNAQAFHPNRSRRQSCGGACAL